jgi:hypothetical protein
VKTNEQLSDEIIELRNQLFDYHERLEQALEHNTEFQLNATWGIVHSALFNGAWVGGIYGFSRLWRWLFSEAAPSWAFFIVTPLSLLLAGAVSVWSQKGHEKDKKKLYRWPEWKFHPYE